MRKSTSSHGERVVKDIKRKTCKQYSAETIQKETALTIPAPTSAPAIRIASKGPQGPSEHYTTKTLIFVVQNEV